jgi:coatomer protein complex subunit epsilon
MSEPDELYTLRNLFWLGNYQLAINESNSLSRIPKHLQSVKDEFVYRSYLAMRQYDIVLDEISDGPNTSVALRAIRILALYMSGVSGYEQCLGAMFDLGKDLQQGDASCGTYYLILATLHVHGDNIKEALIATDSFPNMELASYAVQLLLRLDRPDLAQQRHAIMKSADEDGTLTQLAGAALNIRLGGAKNLQDAANMYQDLGEKYGPSVMILTSMAVAEMAQNDFATAETHLQEALGKDASNPDTLANIIVVSQHLAKSSEVVSRYISQLRKSCPQHPMLVGLANFDSAYDRMTAQLSS